MLGVLSFWQTPKLVSIRLFQNDVQEKKEQWAICYLFVRRGWESSWICHPACPHDLVQSWDLLLQPTTSMRKENLWLQRFLFLFIWWSTDTLCDHGIWAGQCRDSSPCQSGQCPPLACTQCHCNFTWCTSVARCGSEQAPPGDANSWVTASLQHWPLPPSSS